MAKNKSNQMEKQITITFRWWPADGSNKPIPVEHQEALEESANERINKMRSDGFTSGELNDNINMLDTDPEDGVAYRGWFEINTKTIS
jgi:hypothetical protein